MRIWIKPPNPRTPAQQANRSRFRQAMISWRSLPDYEKDSYNRRARKLSMTGHNLYISRSMKGQTAKDRENGADQIKPAGRYLTSMEYDEGYMTCSSQNPVHRQADTYRASVRAERSTATSASFDRSVSRRMSDRLLFALSCGETKKGTSRPCSGSFSSLPGMPRTGSSSLHGLYRCVTVPSAPAYRLFTHPKANALPHG